MSLTAELKRFMKSIYNKLEECFRIAMKNNKANKVKFNLLQISKSRSKRNLIKFKAVSSSKKLHLSITNNYNRGRMITIQSLNQK